MSLCTYVLGGVFFLPKREILFLFFSVSCRHGFIYWQSNHNYKHEHQKKSDEPKTTAIGKESYRERTYTEFEENTTTLPTRRYTFSPRSCTTSERESKSEKKGSTLVWCFARQVNNVLVDSLVPTSTYLPKCTLERREDRTVPKRSGLSETTAVPSYYKRQRQRQRQKKDKKAFFLARTRMYQVPTLPWQLLYVYIVESFDVGSNSLYLTLPHRPTR